MKLEQMPSEFDLIKTGKGYTMKGWDFTRQEIADAVKDNRMLNPAYELSSNTCPWNCFFCFTEDPNNPEGLKKKLAGEMTLDERISLIDQSAELGAKSINLIGAGEPTIDKNFWDVVGHMSDKGITPIVYTEGALKLTDENFAKRLYDTGSTVVLKVNSLKDRDYQNSTVVGGIDRVKPLKMDYFKKRNEALDVLIKTGFNDSDPTRLAFDTIICQENYDEIPEIHRYARDNNIFVLFVNYLPSGRSSTPMQNSVTHQEQFAMFDQIAKIDREEYELEHRSKFPYAGGVPCSIRGLGLYVKIKGDAWDCPGELESLGNVKDESLESIWNKTTHIRQSFDGGCLPRKLFWQKYGKPESE
jgi:MoaA/NifB/PqqE/SkfB family radical SAM enzyme